jgi:hypothetical protein
MPAVKYDLKTDENAPYGRAGTVRQHKHRHMHTYALYTHLLMDFVL